MKRLCYFLFLLATSAYGSTDLNPTAALTDFRLNVELPAGNRSVNLAMLSVCKSGAGINPTLGAGFDSFAQGLVDIRVPQVQGCSHLLGVRTSSQVHRSAGEWTALALEWFLVEMPTAVFGGVDFDFTPTLKAEPTIVGLYRKSLESGISAGPARLMISFWRYFPAKAGAPNQALVGSQTLDPLSIPVLGELESGKPLEIKVPDVPGTTRISASLLNPSGLAPANVNMPLAALRPEVARVLLDQERTLLLSDYLRLGLLYYSTQSADLWAKLSTVSQEWVHTGGALRAKIAALRTLPQSERVGRLSRDASLDAYLHIYRENLQEVVFNFDHPSKDLVKRVREPSAELITDLELEERLEAGARVGHLALDAFGGYVSLGSAVVNQLLR
jgi:hypothetical protein